MDSINFLDPTIHKDKSVFKIKKQKQKTETLFYMSTVSSLNGSKKMYHMVNSVGAENQLPGGGLWVQIRGDAVMLWGMELQERNKPQKAYTKTKSPDRQTQLERNAPKQTKDRPVFVTTTTFVTEAENIKGHLTKTGTLLKVLDNWKYWLPYGETLSTTANNNQATLQAFGIGHILPSIRNSDRQRHP